MISEEALRRDEKVFASGGFADVRRGELVGRNCDRRKVCLKTIKVTTKGGEEGRKECEKVRDLPSFPIPARLRDLRPSGIPQGSLPLDAIEASEHCPVLRRRGRSASDSHRLDGEWGSHGLYPE